MIRQFVVSVALLLSGCSIAPQQNATAGATVERVDAPTHNAAISLLELDLLLNLWLHMKDEERRLQTLIDDPKTPDEKRNAAKVLLPHVKEQAQETLTAMFRD